LGDLGGLGGIGGMGSTPGSRGTRRGADGVPPEVTPNADFYTVSKNFADPRVRGDEWRLFISGEVRQAEAIPFEALGMLPQREQWQTLVCISNPVGGDFAGNALWRGVSVADVLALAGGPTTTAKVLVVRGADGYVDTIPLAKALEPTTLLVTHMNGETLPRAHGSPARLLVPGVYGLKNVKWVTNLDLVQDEVRGYWQQRGWTLTAAVKTTSRIDFPRRGAIPAAAATRIAGMAFAGDRGISRVEVSDDGGQTWRVATLRLPKGPLSWVFWELPWNPQPAEYRLQVRATDGASTLQASAVAPSLPDGAAGWHQVNVRVT
jgi:DMSO/TMAO reductase YedYZ molybdopterin-dependent catalytic subunit